jgi:ABC-2 type transport system ATP-binding protein
VLFSSHILSDAESLCSAVGILARGRLVAGGSLSDLTGGGRGGSEVVVTGLVPAVAERLRPRLRGMTRIADGRYSLDLGPDLRPESLIAELSAIGVVLVSVTPSRTTLEDVFVEALVKASHGPAATTDSVGAA